MQECMDAIAFEQNPASTTAALRITAESLGGEEFKADYGVRYAYLTGAMYKGIASTKSVVAMAQAGLMGYFGAGGLRLEALESAIRTIQAQLRDGQSYGMNMLCNLEQPEVEERTVDLYLKCGVSRIEAAAYMKITPSLVRYRLKGITPGANGATHVPHKVLAKVSRPEVATAFLQPAPPEIVSKIVARGGLTTAEADLARLIPMADDICVEADSGGHTDAGVALALMPAMMRLRDDMMARHGYAKTVRVGAAGGIGTPQTAAAAFVLGADFILTGSINQCTVEAGISDAVKDLLQEMNVQDTAYAPAGDMFELGARIQVLKRGLFFPARANKLYELYQRHNSLDEIEPSVRKQIQEKFFRRSFEDVWTETEDYLRRTDPKKLAEIESNPKRKMAAIFKWYFIHSTRLAMEGNADQKVDYQVHCGPALGAFNQWVKGTATENWRNRRVATLAEMIMRGAAAWLNQRIDSFVQSELRRQTLPLASR
ncbi:MAG: PfaD family polyunsaturated fatty acid/polyketide biosynthesis protein [Terracidiphilus sp.]